MTASASTGNSNDNWRKTHFGFGEIETAEKASAVRGIFSSVAGNYDLMNDLMSGGIHRLWKAALIDWIMPRKGQAFLDVAGGTGDVANAIREAQGGAMLQEK